MITPNCYLCVHRIGEWNPETGYKCSMESEFRTIRGKHKCKYFDDEDGENEIEWRNNHY